MDYKIGVGITTFNSEQYFRDLYSSIRYRRIEELVVVNGGDSYTESYDCSKWIQHEKNFGAAKSRNDCLDYLISKNCDYIFLIEDDMVVCNNDIFDIYVNHLKAFNLEYLCFVSTSDDAGPPNNRTPDILLKNDELKLACYHNMCNEFTVRTIGLAKEQGYYDETFEMFDVENVYRMSKCKGVLPFWCFGDVHDSDKLIKNNPNASSRMNVGGVRNNRFPVELAKFVEKHGVDFRTIPRPSEFDIISKIKL